LASDTTDILAAILNDSSHPAHQFLSVDLSHVPNSALANSIAQICQGVIGSLIAESGGLARNSLESAGAKSAINMNGHSISNVSYPYNSGDAVPLSFVDNMKRDIEAKIFQEVNQHFMAFHNKPQYAENSIEAIRERVTTFSLFTDRALPEEEKK
jgi:hypothetical protein